ncbi:uncharacterized protein BO72DRAFT_453007 [Aspergillus fijiensis CBS 313.89]|uniref:Uncharacterized protein n=1 Tax=Aspergillus fijiensis CBS 313.89 TaxID=1448319 RepID=A0A8G1RG16_9EURO|nr:uncharacterized protein BO72DRAFT_453007 [Aspergillus fijiensis CBS 313.89]RAK72088.1 hypothetical protein BO72DRAFT_453007 [Aspergillus fijiensis CBS 313.89]
MPGACFLIVRIWRGRGAATLFVHVLPLAWLHFSNFSSVLTWIVWGHAQWFG